MADEATQSFSYYIMPDDNRHVVVGVNDPDDKGELRVSFGEFFAARTGELGRLSDGDVNRPRVRLVFFTKVVVVLD